MSTGDKENTPRFTATHVEVLTKRAIPLQFAWDHGLRSIDLGERTKLEERNALPKRWKQLGSYPGTGLEFPYPNNDDYCRVRADKRSYTKRGEPGTSMADETIEVPRYICQAGMRVIPYIPREVLGVAGDVTVPIYITEAPGKALALTAHGFFAIGLGGVSAGAHDKSELDALGEVIAHLELRRIQWRHRMVYIVFDAGLGGDDDPGNPLVAQGAAKVWKALSDLGADVQLVRIPYYHPQDSEPETRGDIWSPTDQGPDDFLYRAGLGVDDPEEQMIVRAAAFLALPSVPADPQERFARVIKENPSNQENAVGKVLNELFVQATLQVASDAKLSGVAGVTKGIVGKRGLASVVKEFEERVRARFRKDEPDWVSELVCSASGAPRPVRENVELALRRDPGLAGMLAWNEFAHAIVFARTPPWQERYKASKETEIDDPWTDEDDIRLGSYLAQHYQLIDVHPTKLRAAVVVTARERIIHPVRDYLAGLTWDGTKRLDGWLSTYLGVEESEYSILVGRWWLISAIARALDPGCQVDHILVLEGQQGASKSSVLRVLGGAWYSDADIDPKSKEAAMNMQSSWIHELPEGAIFSRASAKDLKAWATKENDDYTPKHSNLKVRVPRHTVFALTINEHSDYLGDSTGNRRFLPVACGTIDLERLRVDRDQLLAEARAEYAKGTKWWPADENERELCRVEQAARQSHDPWEERVAEGVRGYPTSVTIANVLGGILNLPHERQGRHESLRATACLRVLGWVEGPRNKTARPWVRGPGAEPYKPVALELIEGGLSVDEVDEDAFSNL